MQDELTKANRVAWNTKAYDAWIRLYGAPEQLAEDFTREP